MNLEIDGTIYNTETYDDMEKLCEYKYNNMDVELPEYFYITIANYIHKSKPMCQEWSKRRGSLKDQEEMPRDTWVTETRVNQYGEKENPCWNCKKCSGKCSWSKKFIPIDGWDSRLVTNDVHITHRIYYCPEYVEGE